MREVRNFKMKFEHKYKQYESNVTVKFHVDNNFGADANDNRGTGMTIIDDVEINGLIDDQCDLIDADEDMKLIIGEAAAENLHKFL